MHFSNRKNIFWLALTFHSCERGFIVYKANDSMKKIKHLLLRLSGRELWEKDLAEIEEERCERRARRAV